MNIVIKELPDYEVAFIRRTGSYFEPQEHWGELVHWAINNKLFPPEQHFIGISLDDIRTGEEQKCRHDACVTLPEHFEQKSHERIQLKKLDGGLYALYPFCDSTDKLVFAYRYMFEQWLPNSQYEGDDGRFNLEFNMNNPREDPKRKAKVDLYVPIIEKASVNLAC